jgi:hypothetical protein
MALPMPRFDRRFDLGGELGLFGRLPLRSSVPAAIAVSRIDVFRIRIFFAGHVTPFCENEGIALNENQDPAIDRNGCIFLVLDSH